MVRRILGKVSCRHGEYKNIIMIILIIIITRIYAYTHAHSVNACCNAFTRSLAQYVRTYPRERLATCITLDRALLIVERMGACVVSNKASYSDMKILKRIVLAIAMTFCLVHGHNACAFALVEVLLVRRMGCFFCSCFAILLFRVLQSNQWSPLK